MSEASSRWFADDPIGIGRQLSSASDVELAAVVAERAGEILYRLRQEKPTTPNKESLRELRDLADRVSHDYLMATLGAARPLDAILSEEGADDLARLANDRTWIVDPLDGTNEYGLGRWDFAVHVALWQRGELALGVVAMPSRDLVLRSDGEFSSLKPKAAGEPWRLVVSRTRPPANLAEVLEAVKTRTGRPMEILDVGSVGAKVGEIIAGRADAYVHTTGFYEWDVAAPAAVARAAGLHVSHVDGSQLSLNKENPKVSNLLVARPELAKVLLDLDIA
jgi:3'(2'), 5'-bisphosphate nucleotidase